MMKKYLFIFLMTFSISYSQTYCAGDQISIEDQNATHVVGAGTEEYEVGDSFRLSDWNGDLNGGEYHVIFVDMSASW